MLRTSLIFWISLFVACSAACCMAETPETPETPEISDAQEPWTVEFFKLQTELGRGHNLISYHDQLLLFSVQEKHFRTTKAGPGILKDGQLELLPSFRSYARISAQTLWKDQLVLAGTLPFSFLEADNKLIKKSRLAIFDGLKWEIIGEGFHGRVSAMVQWRDNLIVAGSLNIDGHPELKSLALWDGAGWKEVNGQPSGGGEPRIISLTVHNDDLIIGGIFSEMGGTVVRNLASFDGTSWKAIGGAPNGLIGRVVSFQGDLFANGSFTCIGGQGIEYLARWDGVKWHSLKFIQEEMPAGRINWRFKMLPTPKGLYMAGDLESYTGKKDQNLACWSEQAWIAGVPDIHVPKVFLERTTLFEAARKNKGKKGEISQPRPWPSEPYFQEVSKLELRTVNTLAWHRNELVLQVSYHDSSERFVPDPQLLVLRNHSLFNLLEESEKNEKEVGAYRGGTLHLRNDRDTGKQLYWRSGDREELLGSWYPTRLLRGPSSFLVEGDTLFVIGNFENFAGLPCHNAALFDGTRWHTMGDGLPFDRVVNGKLHTTRFGLYLSATFENFNQSANTGMMKWDGDQWTVVELGFTGHKNQPIKSDGSWLFRANTKHPVDNFFMSPDHQKQAFPAVSNPYIERWNGKRWEISWQGKSGKISKFAHDGQTLWCIVSGGRDANLLKLVNNQWTTMSTHTMAGTSLTSVNSNWSLDFLDGIPVIQTYLNVDQQKRARLASYHNGFWYWFGPDVKHINKLKTKPGHLQFESVFDIESSSKPQKGILKWEGVLPVDEPVTAADLVQLDKWEKICRASDQSDRPEINLPWPRGLNKTKAAQGNNSLERPGWHLSSWPDSISLDQAIETKGKNTIILKPNSWGLNFFLNWDLEQPVLFTFEYRLMGPENWDSVDGNVGSGGQDPWPMLYININNSNTMLRRWALDQQWHKVSIPFGKGYGRETQKLVISAGNTESGSGTFEIKNLRFKKKKWADRRGLSKEITEIWRDYPCPEAPRKRLELLCRKFEKEAKRRNSRISEYDFTRYYTGGGLSNGLLLQQDFRSFDHNNKKAELKLVVDNLSYEKVASGWVPGGGLYVDLNPFSPHLKPGGYFHQLLADSTQIKSIKGLIIDLRDDRADGIPSQYMSNAGEAWSVFADTAHRWGQVQTGTKNSPKTNLVIQPAETPWNNVPVVVLVSEKTPGSVMMVLNTLPNITTVGRPSLPVVVPTRSHLLSNGQFGDFPNGWVYDAEGNDVSLCRIPPDVELPLNASWDAAIREAIPILGLKNDPDSSFCPVESIPPGG